METSVAASRGFPLDASRSLGLKGVEKWRPLATFQKHSQSLAENSPKIGPSAAARAPVLEDRQITVDPGEIQALASAIQPARSDFSFVASDVQSQAQGGKTVQSTTAA